MNALKAKANMVVCARCRKQVDKSRTQITDGGLFCDECYRAIYLEDG
jgi:formylmethanofuran dehydrogenase subunit E